VGQGFSLQQPQDKVLVAPGETITLNCTMSGLAGPGPVRWLKGWGSGNKTVYDQRGYSLPRVTRAVPASNTDFTIHIRNAQPEDMGTYYCVKFAKSDSGVDEVVQRGSGTEVSVYEAALVPGMGAAAVVLCFLLGVLVALCMYRRKRQGRVGSPCPARTVTTGSSSSIPLQCCAGTPSTPRFVLSTSSFCTLNERTSIREENDIHYTDLQPLPLAPGRGRSLGTASTEYASLRVAAK
ncbi:SHPS1 phosphatase, partial [Zosterops hypoxanthus]|nr:SHPS1 phosphatase [Zosterops hypoxanthus]